LNDESTIFSFTRAIIGTERAELRMNVAENVNSGFGYQPSAPHSEAVWYAVSIRSRQEKMSASMLEHLAIPNFLPLVHKERRWSDRIKAVALPLFPGYLFVHLANLGKFKPRVLKVPGVVDFVGNQNGPLPISEKEIENVRAVLSLGIECSPYPFLKVGNRVRVVRGALAGIEGTLARCGSQSTFVISIEMIQRSVAITVSGNDLEPVLCAPTQ
jgi:transcription antitermination factor NusG